MLLPDSLGDSMRSLLRVRKPLGCYRRHPILKISMVDIHFNS